MKISSVAFIQIQNTHKKPINRTKKQFTSQNTVNKTDKNFSHGFYLPLSFKADANSSEYQILENQLNSFYEKNKNAKLKNLYTRFADFELTSSRLINNAFNKMISKEIEFSQTNQKVSEKDILNAIQKGLFCTNFHIHKKINHDKLTPEEIIDISKDNAEKILSKIKYNENFKSFPLKKNSRNFQQLSFEIYNEVEQLYSNLLPNGTKFISRLFLDEYMKNIKENVYPIFDEELFNNLKILLQKEPFVSFDKQMLKVEKQRKENGFNPEQTATEIYNDSINQEISPFENRKLYDFLAKDNENLDYLLENIYGFYYPKIQEEFSNSNIATKHKVLLVDPCIYAHFEELTTFIKEKNINTENIEPIDLRNKFSEYLGTETIYRGLYSPEPEQLIKKLKEEGNFASIYQNPQKTIEAIKYYITNKDGVSVTALSHISRKIKYPEEKSEFISVSSIYDVAASVPKFVGEPQTPVVVIKAEVPKLILIKQKGLFSDRESSAINKTLKIGDREFPYNRDQQKIEIFIPFYLPLEKAEYIIDTQTNNFKWV